MSFSCVVGAEKLVENVPVDGYLDTTFSARRYELYETSTASKNTIFINGVGVAEPGKVETTVLGGRGYEGFRMDATGAMGRMRDGLAARFCGRAMLLVKHKGVLVIDRVELPYAGLVESRLHTFCKVAFGKTDVKIRGKRQRMHISFAASEPARIKPGMGMPTEPRREPDTTIRYVSERKVYGMTLCYFMMPNGKAEVSLAQRGKRSVVTVSGDVSARIGFETDGLGF